jgi:DNA-directed RNA polymerase subunit RPC12/RpoP
MIELPKNRIVMGRSATDVILYGDTQPLPPGITWSKCAACGEAVALTRHGAQFAASGTATVVCTPCGLKLVKSRSERGLPTSMTKSPYLRERLDADPELRAKFEKATEGTEPL